MAEASMMFDTSSCSSLSSRYYTSSVHRHHHHHHHRPRQIQISTFPHIYDHAKSALSSSSAIGFPSLKSSSSDFHGRCGLVAPIGGGVPRRMKTNPRAVASSNPRPQMSIGIGKAQKWWEKGIQPNMREVKGAQDFVDSLLNAGDNLVVVDFFSPGCGGCRALHPKICQLAEMNPDVQFLQVNYEEHKSMCYTLNVHVLPFFRFYRGAHGRLCSFSCTNATIKKFKDALAKHSPDRCSIGPTKGLEEKELVALAANKDLSFKYTPKTDTTLHIPIPISSQEEIPAESPSPSSPAALPLPLPSTTSSKGVLNSEDKSLVSTAGR